MRNHLRLMAVALFLAPTMAPVTASAAPVTLKLAFFGSDRSALYLAGVKPFVNAVNAAANGSVRIEVYFSSELGPVTAEPKLLSDGGADVAFMIPGYTPDVFYDDAVVELPGLFRDARQATLVYTQLAARNAFKSYDKFVVLGTFASEPQSIHSRKPVGSIAALKGLNIRTNNVTEAAALEKLGAKPVLLPINKTAEAISRGTLDGAMAPPAMLFEFGIGRVAGNHYMLRGSAALMLLAMNRQSFDRLSAEAQKVIKQYSGAWAAARYIDTIDSLNASVLEQINSDPKRNLTFPSPSDRKIAQSAYDSVAQEWAGTDADRAKQLELLRAELAKLKSSEMDGRNVDVKR